MTIASKSDITVTVVDAPAAWPNLPNLSNPVDGGAAGSKADVGLSPSRW